MARYFKYKTMADLLAENARLGIDLRFSDDLSPLNQPLQIGDRTIANRWCIHPMEGCDGGLDGSPGELTHRRYRRFGSGGAMLIWGEACAVSDDGRANPRQLWLHDENIRSFETLVQNARQNDGLLVGLQLTHSGRYSYRRPQIAVNDPILHGRYKVDANTPILRDDELKLLVDQYVASAKLAAKCGFDFVDVKQCHRYLLSELLGARTRPGNYGGSFENRTRLAREIIQAIRATVPGLMIASRVNVYDGIPYRMGDDGVGTPESWTAPFANGWGMNADDPAQFDLSEPLRWISEMRSLGVVLVNVTIGNPYAQPHFNRPFEYPPPDGYESPEHPLIGVDRQFRAAAAVQESNPGFPVVGTGYSYLQEFLPQAASANVLDGRVTIVGVGRASLAQPDWVKELNEHGKLDRKRICRTFSYCTALMRAKDHPLGQYPTGCPPFDKEAYHGVWQEVLEKRKSLPQ